MCIRDRSETTDGAGADAAVVFAVILGTGTGAGIAVHGRVLRGPNGLAGEWGHNPVPWGAPGEDPPFDCYCGQRGCGETLLSGSGLARDHAHVTGQVLVGETIVARASQGLSLIHICIGHRAGAGGTERRARGEW